MIDFAAARAYAARTSDAGHARLLASLDPDWRPPVRPPLNLAPVRAQRAAARAQADTDRRAPVQAEAPRTRTLNVGAVRRAREAAAAAEWPPQAPPGATWAVDPGGRWCWALVEPGLGGDTWGRLALGLAAAGGLRSLHARPGPCGGDVGEMVLRRSPDGDLWAVVTVDTTATGPTPVRTVRHELAHVADEIARLRAAGGPEAWADAVRCRDETQAEAFAQGAEEWLTPEMTAAQVIARASAHQRARRPRTRARGR
ncbi:hypothetical protein ACIQK6_13650 [Streptomyces sp. NPDC091682]|uniref:hypothetical protein n=1 Tax=Streptomyces sp. NPDC091682 TaxID=3366005 RepID=UPI0038246523